MKKNREYILYLIVFLIVIFGSKIDNFAILVNPNLSSDKINNEYCKEIQNNNQELIKLNNININNDYNLIISKVKYRNIYNFKNEITIYKGFLDNVNLGDAIMDESGLIGVVSRTFEHSSLVELISNKDSNISVKINESYGILKNVNDSLLVKEISNYENINVGDFIYTSGYGNLKSGIYIGKVKSINLNKTEIEKVIEVELGANLDNINYVFIYGGSHV